MQNPHDIASREYGQEFGKQRFLSITEAARFFGMNRSTILRYIAQDLLEAVYIGKSVRITKTSIIALIK